MLKVQCDACGAPYEVDPRRIPKAGLKMRCPGCGASVLVAAPGTAPAAAAAPKGDDFGLDLPTPKPGLASSSKGAFAARAPTAAAKQPALAGGLGETDLPALKGSAGAKFAPAPGAQAASDSLTDLPALKGHPANAPPSPTRTLAFDEDVTDLPAPKAPAKNLSAPVSKGTLAGTGGSSVPSAHPPAAPSAQAADFELDLPAPKRPALTTDFELDLPAPKRQAPSANLGAEFAPKRPAAGADLSADLPAPKRPALNPARAPEGALRPTDLELDLPTPKRQAPSANFGAEFAPKRPAGGADLSADLPAPKRPALNSARAPEGALRPADLDFDLPAPKRPAASADLSADLPARKRPALTTDLDFDLPAPKPAAAPASAKRAPGLLPQTQPDFVPGPQAPQMMAKDSLAIDPEPFLAGGGPGQLGRLDDISARRHEEVDLPAPADLPQRKAVDARGPNPPARAVGPMAAGPGSAGGRMLPKDSLDLPQGFASADVGIEIVGSPFDARAQPQPKPRSAAAAPAATKPLTFDPGDLDLPAPADLPVALDFPIGKQTPGSTGPKRAGLARDSLDLPPGRAPAAGRSQARSPDGLAPGMAPDFDLQLPEPNVQGSKPRLTGADFDEFQLPSPRSERASKAPSAGAAKAPPRNATIALSGDDLDLPGSGDGDVLSLPPLSDKSRPSVPSLANLDLDPFADFGGERPQGGTLALDASFESAVGRVPPPPSRPQPAAARRGAGGGAAFGELDFGLGGDELAPGQLPVPMPMPVPVDQAQSGFTAAGAAGEVPLTQSPEVAAPSTKKKKKKKHGPSKPTPAWVWPLALLVLLLGTGVGLGMFTTHGWFGVYLVEQMLPAAGDPILVAEAIAQAEKQAQSDTHAELRRSLVTLSDARNEAGLNRELLARSLLHEALYQLRFGDDFNSAQRAVAILARVMERGADAPGLTLARAADTARRGELSEAKALLDQAPANDDPYHALVAGELALLEKQPARAATAFERARKLGATARASWGLVRAQVMAGKLPEAEAANELTLKASPRHSGALAFTGERALARGDLAAAMDLARKASGRSPVEESVHPSRADRARAFALEGLAEERSEHPREAHAAYEQALAADPLKLDILIGSARMLMRLGRARDALTRFDSALGAKPAEVAGEDGKIPLVEATVGSAQALLAQQRNREALERLQNLLKKFPQQFEVNLWLGHTLVAVESWDEAEVALQKAIELGPNDFSGYVALSQLLFKRGRAEEAARLLADATGKVKDSAEVRRMLGNSELVRNHLPEAIKQFNAALKFDARDPGALFGLCVAQRKHGDIANAEKTLARLSDVDPAFPGLPLERGQLLETRGDYAGAAEAYRKALADRPQDSDLKLRLGAALVTAGRVDEAETLVREVLKERPTSAEAEHFMGRILFARSDTAQALQRFERAVNFDNLRAEYHMYLGWAHLEQGNLSGALNSVNAAIERDPSLADAYWVLGRIQLRTGAVKDALESFQRTLRLKPGRVEAVAGMGDVYDQLRDQGKAIKAYQEAVKLAPEHGEWWFRLGTLQLDKGNREEARVALAEAVLRGDRLADKPSWVADAHRAYAEILRESGRTAEAMDQYRAFLSLAPSGHPDRHEVTRILRSAGR